MNIQQAIDQHTKKKLFISISSNPGSVGSIFYNTMFKYHGIDAEYVACYSSNLLNDLELARQHCSGVSISMPFKDQLKPFINHWRATNFVANTIKITNHEMTAYNCDLMGLEHLFNKWVYYSSVNLLGDGAMAKNILEVAKLKSWNVSQYSRKLGNWDQRHTWSDILINTTSVGMHSQDMPVDDIPAGCVVDCVIGKTRLTESARTQAKQYVTGAQIYLEQFRNQYRVYTDHGPDEIVMAKIAKDIFR